MMYNISTHTTQINGWIALTRDLSYFSHSLSRLNYVVDIIEQEMEHSNGTVKPDVLLTSTNENQSIITDCKSNTLTKDQTERYLYLENNPETILEATEFKSKIDSSEYSVEACYSSFSDLTDHRIILLYNIAFVHFEHSSSGVLISNKSRFDDEDLAKIFPINMRPDKNLPTEYYPFDIEQREDYQEFVSSLIQSLIHNAANESIFDVEEALRDAHPYWQQIGEEKQEHLIQEANKIMMKLKSEEISEYIEKISKSKGEYIVHYRTATALQKRLSDPDFIERVASQIDQQTLE